MPVTILEHAVVSKQIQIGSEVVTVTMTGAPTSHNYMQITNLSANRVAGTFDGTTPVVPNTDSPASFGNGFTVPENTINGGVRFVRYQADEFSSLKFAAAASGTRLLIEIARVGKVGISR